MLMKFNDVVNDVEEHSTVVNIGQHNLQIQKYFHMR